MTRAFVVFTFISVATLASLVVAQEQTPQTQDEQSQEEPSDKPPTYSETVVVTASKVDTQIINAPAAISVIGADVIASSGAQNYGDLIRTVPGANVAQTSARDINITSRGATSTLSNTQIALLDGRTIYQDFFGFVAWDFLPIDTSEIAQIEVINGPASAVWGPNAMTGVVNVISKTPRELDGTAVTLGFGAINRSGGSDGQDLDAGTGYHVNLRHAQALNERWAFKFSGGAFGMDALARPVGTVPVVNDPERGVTGGGAYPPYDNEGTTQPKFDVRVDYDHPDGRQKYVFAGGIAGTRGIIHSGIGPFNIQSGTVLGYGKVNYQRDDWKVNFFTNILDGDAPALLAIGVDGNPIDFTFANKTYDIEVANSQLLGTKHLINYGGNLRYNTFDLSIAPGGDSRTEGGFYIQDEIFLSDHFRWLVGGRVDAFSVLNKAVFSPRTTFMIKPTPDHTFRVSYNQAFRAPSFVNSFLDVTILQQVALPGLGPFVFPIHATGNTDLNEEKLTAYEVGYTGTLGGRHTVSAAFYINDTSDSILFTTSSVYTSANPPPGWPLSPQVLDGLAAQRIFLPSGLTYLPFEGVRDKGVELGLNTRATNDLSLYANYSWQAEPIPDNPDDFGEYNVAPANRFNAGAAYDRGSWFANLSLNFTDSAFWTDVLDARFHGPTESYTMLNGGVGVRLAEQKVTLSVKFTNVNDAKAQQHVFGDILKRQIFAELKFNF
jgi:iron complex outermembrane receptor protein